MDTLSPIGDNGRADTFRESRHLTEAQTTRPQRQLRKAKITALGAYVPSRVLTNADLEKMVDTSDEWIMTRTGIRERHIVGEGEATSAMAVEAARRCLEERGLPPTEVETIIVATVTPDMLFPATACLVQDRLGAKGAWGFDLSAACSGFIYALQVGAKLIESGAQSKVLVIGADTMSSIMDYTDRSTCILFGDGAGAVLLEPAGEGEQGIIDYVYEIDGSGGQYLRMPGGGSLHPPTHETVDRKMHYVQQEGQPVFKYAVPKMAELAEKVLARNGFKAEDVQLMVPHQANKRIIQGMAKRIGLPEERILINIDRYGNTTDGTLPLGLATAREENRLKKGDLVLLATVGAGFTAGACVLRWEL
jgi:3-oxoacyl-[acyl-carrier-protein] synthase-3